MDNFSNVTFIPDVTVVTDAAYVLELSNLQLHQLSQVKWAVLEGDGRISIVPEDILDQSKRGKPKGQDIN